MGTVQKEDFESDDLQTDLTTVECVKCIGTPKKINFPFVPNGKLIISGVPKFRTLQYRNNLKYWDR